VTSLKNQSAEVSTKAFIVDESTTCIASGLKTKSIFWILELYAAYRRCSRLVWHLSRLRFAESLCSYEVRRTRSPIHVWMHKCVSFRRKASSRLSFTPGTGRPRSFDQYQCPKNSDV